MVPSYACALSFSFLVSRLVHSHWTIQMPHLRDSGHIKSSFEKASSTLNFFESKAHIDFCILLT